MAPPKSRGQTAVTAEEPVTNGIAVKEARQPSGRGNGTATTNGKTRKSAAAAAAAAASSSSASVAIAAPATTVGKGVVAEAGSGSAVATDSKTDSLPGSATAPGLGSESAGENLTDWIGDDLETMNRFRATFRLQATPTAYTLPYGHIVLERGIGKLSPTTAVRKKRGTSLVTRDKLAMVVRQSFKTLAVNEGEVMAEFMYNIKTANKSFRYTGAPTRKR